MAGWERSPVENGAAARPWFAVQVALRVLMSLAIIRHPTQYIWNQGNKGGWLVGDGCLRTTSGAASGSVRVEGRGVESDPEHVHVELAPASWTPRASPTPPKPKAFAPFFP